MLNCTLNGLANLEDLCSFAELDDLELAGEDGGGASRPQDILGVDTTYSTSDLLSQSTDIDSMSLGEYGRGSNVPIQCNLLVQL